MMPYFKKPHSPVETISRYIRRTLPLRGHMIECGVYFGGTMIALLNRFQDDLRASSKKLYGCDTFGGVHPIFDPTNTSVHRDCDPTDLILHIDRSGFRDVAKLLFGYVDVTLPFYLSNEQFSFVWVDVDTYHGTTFCLDFMKERMVPGGIIGVHDYEVSWSKDTIDTAVSEAFLSPLDDRFEMVGKEDASVFFMRRP